MWLANIGVQGKSAMLHLEDLWIRNITVTIGLVDTYNTPTLQRMLAADRLDTTRFITHRHILDRVPDPTRSFSQPQQSGALRVV